MYRRERHQIIASLLSTLDGELLKQHQCYFGGGTAIAMRYGEFRTSFDIDFLIADNSNFVDLKSLVRGQGFAALIKPDFRSTVIGSDPIMDKYAIRGSMRLLTENLKFEIVVEGYLTLDEPSDEDFVNGIASLTEVDLVATKLLANSDRFSDDGTFNRDAIDLAFMEINKISKSRGYQKALSAYGADVERNLIKAIDNLQSNPDWLDRCMNFMEIEEPRCVVLKKLATLRAGLD